MDSTTNAYDAAAAGVRGFRVTIGGSFTQALRFAFVMDPNTTLPSPFVTLPGTGTHDVLISNAMVPSTWDVANAVSTSASPRSRRYRRSDLGKVGATH